VLKSEKVQKVTTQTQQMMMHVDVQQTQNHHPTSSRHFFLAFPCYYNTTNTTALLSPQQ